VNNAKTDLILKHHLLLDRMKLTALLTSADAAFVIVYFSNCITDWYIDTRDAPSVTNKSNITIRKSIGKDLAD